MHGNMKIYIEKIMNNFLGQNIFGCPYHSNRTKTRLDAVGNI